MIYTLDTDAMQQTSNDFSLFNYCRPDGPTKNTKNNESFKYCV